jgi:hypothetical protein
MSYALDKSRQAYGQYRCKIDHHEGQMKNPFDKDERPMEWFGYMIEQERIETLEDLLSEQAGGIAL